MNNGKAARAEEAPRFTRRITWRRVDEEGEEEFGLLESDSAPHWILQGLVDFPVDDDKALWVRYLVACDANWQTRRVLLATATNPLKLVDFPDVKPLITLTADGMGNWSMNERERPDLQGCLDVDLGCSPSTNTLPIRRLNLGAGESAEVTAAWVRFPDLSVQPLHQRYTRLAPHRYRYESLESSFTADLTVDNDGLVVDYPGGWRRTMG
ncbi:MAG TPA: putative glycolipid-binding domain-containing protein [Ktedonobacterales bacterium]|nr:putative glycolipid-binding domain-containing protein [Ktedonobacterales bacterium]